MKRILRCRLGRTSTHWYCTGQALGALVVTVRAACLVPLSRPLPGTMGNDSGRINTVRVHHGRPSCPPFPLHILSTFVFSVRTWYAQDIYIYIYIYFFCFPLLVCVLQGQWYSMREWMGTRKIAYTVRVLYLVWYAWKYFSS